MTLIQNAKTLGRYLGLDNKDQLYSVDCLIEKGRVSKLSQTPIEDFKGNIIDGKGMFLSPGLVDPQVHFREPGMEYKEDIESGSKTAARGGFTAVVSMPNTSPTADNPEVVEAMWNKQKEVGLCRVYPTGALSFNLKGEEITDFKKLKDAGAVAITDDGKGVQKDEVFLKAMKQAKEFSLPILDHSEDESLSMGGSIHKGKISEKYGIKGIDSNSESEHVRRGCAYSEQTGAHYHVLHISTKKSIEHVREAKSKGLNVTAEVSPHHLLLCDEDIPEREDGTLDANWKMNPPLRSKEDRQACVEALIDGTIDAIATDHAPHAPHEKEAHIEKAPFGIIGLETAFPLIYTKFVKTGKISLGRCIELMSLRAAELFNLPHGRLEEGELADLALFDLDREYTVDPSQFASKSKNSPFIGLKLFGRAKLTLLEGRVVHSDL
ncbi:MAG: dihydroorotase [Halobacteriovoraceae bacterium]|nr:dihydroorotase [Halobacteriovoraceae bacterium]|tara:strand:+ start:22697 stop:24004 length:1308 start_codon:yes stop_codon:yes gene_type:complete